MNNINLPNILTSLRLLFLLPAMCLLLHGSAASLALSLLVVIIIEVTDFLDGYLARKLNQVSDLGKLFDPFCDTMVHLMMFLCLVSMQVLPVWIMAIFLLRELVVAQLRMLCMGRGYVLGARPWGKRKANFQTAMLIATIVALLAQKAAVWPLLAAWLMVIAAALTVSAVIVTIISLFDYSQYVWREFVKEARVDSSN